MLINCLQIPNHGKNNESIIKTINIIIGIYGESINV